VKGLVPFLAVAALVVASPGQAITFGQLDGNRHPNVGALIVDFHDGDGPGIVCSGTLIAPKVFLTASHCTDFLPAFGIGPSDVFVTFDSAFDASSPLIGGTYHTNPLFASGGFNDTHDIAVITLDRAPRGITPAQLPTRNFLDTVDKQTQRFVAVGYGTVREAKQKGPASLFFDGQRRFAEQSMNSLVDSWLKLSMNPSTGSGGTCFGDSGGPHFLGTTSIVVSLTVTGDRFCRSTDVTYRTDTDSARSFLAQFVTLL
jgi:secreted trypsin-like serine protease